MSLVRLIRPGPEEAILYTDPDGPALREFIGRLDAQVDQILNKGDLCAQISRVLGLGPIEINLSPASGGDGGNSGGNSTPPSSSAWRKIGQGQCGIVFGMGVTPTTVVKVARQKIWHSSLRVDYESHNAVFESMKRFTSSPRVPRPYWLVGPQSSDWWSESTASLQQAGLPALVELPTVALGSEHIPPIPKAGRECLIDLFCPLEKREEAKQDPLNKDCLVRLYLGRDIRRRDKSLPVPEFSLRNFILHVNQMRNPLNLPIEYLAWQMAEALAIMHWAAHVDAYDVEFVLGSTPWDIRPMRDASRASTPEDDEKAGAPPEEPEPEPEPPEAPGRPLKCRKHLSQLWLLDFNQCAKVPMEQVREKGDAILERFVVAFFENDPYYPLPLMEGAHDQQIWMFFRDAYIQKAHQVLGLKAKIHAWADWAKTSQLPERFMAMCVEREKVSLAAGNGHGFRYERQ